MGTDTGGRPLDDIPAWLVQSILEYRGSHDAWPSGRWVRRLTGQRTGAEFNNDKQKRALALAQERWGDE